MQRGFVRPALRLALALALAGVGSAAWAQDDTGAAEQIAPPPPRELFAPPPAIVAPEPQQPAPEPDGPVPFLFINQERLLTASKSGQALLAEEDKERDALRAEARALDQSFEKEERELTDRRPKMAPEEFRKLSDAFDARVVKARRDQDGRAATLAQEFDQRRRQFYAQVAPILVTLMDRYGAKAIFDENSVLLADQSLNITQGVIAEIDARAPQARAPAPGTPEPSEAVPGNDGGN